MGNTPTQDVQSQKSGHSPSQQFKKYLKGPTENGGYYYHKQDEQKVNENIKHNTDTFSEIPIIFEYTGFALDQYLREKNQNQNPCDDPEEEQQENKNDDNDDLKSLKEYQEIKFEWRYRITNDPDNKTYRKINDISFRDTTYKLPEKYEKVRAYLYENDPIPPLWIEKQKWALKVLNDVIDTSLEDKTELKCKVIVKNVSEKPYYTVYHPALLLWDPNTQKDIIKKSRKDAYGYIVHLIKSEQDGSSNNDQKIEEMEIECRMVTRLQLDKSGYSYEKYKAQDLKLSNGLTDIAHWCLKYEMMKEFKYVKYKTDCVQFMKELCKEFKINHTDDEDWGKSYDTLPYRFGRAGNQVIEFTNKVKIPFVASGQN